MPVPAKDIGILIVDDFTTMRKIIKTVLKQLGFVNTIEAEDGESALQVLRGSTAIRLVISDWHMPNMSGLELLKAVRSDPKLEHLPFLMISAEADKENMLQAAQYGVSNYIMKPFNALAMRDKIEKIFS